MPSRAANPGRKEIIMQNLSFEEILDFTESEDMANSKNVHRLRQMWTQYCRESNWFSNVDTYAYDSRIAQIWNTLRENPTFHYSGFDFCRFDMFMAKSLV